MSFIISFSIYFVENCEELSKKLSIPVVYTLQPGNTYHVFSAHDAAKQLLEFQVRNPETKYIIYQSENILSNFFQDKTYIRLMQQNSIFQYSPMIADTLLRRYGIPCASYFNWSYPDLSSDVKRDIKVLFFGSMTQKRHEILHQISQKYPITIVTDKFGKDLDEILLRTEWVLNISTYTNNALETHRINKAIACGCQVLSNPSCDDVMDKKYKEFIRFSRGRRVQDYVKALDKFVY